MTCNEEHDFTWAIEQIKKGKNISRKSWINSKVETPDYLNERLGRIFYVTETCVELYKFYIIDFEATDWKIYEKEQWPKVFKDRFRKIEVDEVGCISIDNFNIINKCAIGSSLPILYKAVELSKKLRNE